MNLPKHQKNHLKDAFHRECFKKVKIILRKINKNNLTDDDIQWLLFLFGDYMTLLIKEIKNCEKITYKQCSLLYAREIAKTMEDISNDNQ